MIETGDVGLARAAIRKTARESDRESQKENLEGELVPTSSTYMKIDALWARREGGGLPGGAESVRNLPVTMESTG